MASVRISLKHEAWRLADRHRDVADAGLEIPETVIDRLHGIASSAHNPTDTLRWAWLSQHASYMDTASTADGLAAMYLLGALLHADRLEPAHAR
jgi:hypothetical protein